MRRRLVTVAACLAATAALVAAADGAPSRQAGGDGDRDGAEATLVEEGRALYRTSCISCHGPDGQGQDAPNGERRGPSLEDAGPAGAYYQLTTGRMPIGNPDDLPQRKEPAYSPDEIEALLAYIDTLTEGPEVPEVDAAAGDLSHGGEIFRENCQSCHSATGAGGALSYGQAAPPLGPADDVQIGAAVRSGPDPMPRFVPDIISDEELDDLVAYVEYLDRPDDRGGLALGRLGPIPEGFMIWVGGLGLLLVAAFWMGQRRRDQPRVDPEPPGEDDGDPGTAGVDAGGNAPLAEAAVARGPSTSADAAPSGPPPDEQETS
jgi:ubiquinol-cytochrome c reductase cytochrome c subunit